ncbi:ferritin-like domain-containing protein [Methylomonas sp. CM2]|uniref:ferritin-like domain-containing protein n=1 Tax=Methylomonas sp. CM2 TaxID=3417647 RepID=UPI003CE80322
MENLFEIAERCLFDGDIAAKLNHTRRAKQLCDAGALAFDDTGRVRAMADTEFPARPISAMPRDMPRRRLDSDAGKAAFFHALAHIEFVAIYLAWDMVYRFRGLPADFYRDWLAVAAEEAEHFAMIREHMRRYSVDYGDLPAHRGLWTHAEDTVGDVLARLAVVPRCMEARGLDVTPGMIAKLQALGDVAGVAVLTRIYQDEIGHVERGSYWFKRLSAERGLNPEQHYQTLLLTHYQGKPKGPFNREVRIIAGFSDHEIDWLEERLHE